MASFPAAILLCVAVLGGSPAGAFKPWEAFGHKGIVENALLGGTWNGNTYSPLEYTTASGARLRFSRQAVEELSLIHI